MLWMLLVLAVVFGVVAAVTHSWLAGLLVAFGYFAVRMSIGYYRWRRLSR